MVPTTSTNPPPYPDHPPPSFHPGGSVVHTVVPGAIVVTNAVGAEPGPFVCKSCNESITTRIDRKSTLKTHLFALLLCMVGCIPCMCIPYCMNSCKNTDHYCPNCNAYIGTYSR